MRCQACDYPLGGEPRDREDFCGVCNLIIASLLGDLDELDIEIPFGLYEDWEEAEKEDEDDEI
jgi:hypothetical protein